MTKILRQDPKKEGQKRAGEKKTPAKKAKKKEFFLYARSYLISGIFILLSFSHMDAI